ncbi:MAG TPA: DUF202 domain-containing protein [Chondromyces sp.]|nr:DUF202 domain-containing protein [Chondromyces sp.]
MEKQRTEESKYIQQHLANERTFLAWLRTAIAIVGIGFLAVSLHLNFGPHVGEETDRISVFMMVFSLVIGLFVLFVGTASYLIKRKQINEGGFQSISSIVVVITSGVGILIVLLGFYFIRII